MYACYTYFSIFLVVALVVHGRLGSYPRRFEFESGVWSGLGG